MRTRTREQRQHSEDRGPDGRKSKNDEQWPFYPCSASNETPVELPPTRKPGEMCGESNPRKPRKASTLHGSDVVELG
jgi:hypothetical protein